MTTRLGLALTAAVLAGCGGAQETGEERAVSEWQSRTGVWWEAYEAGFRMGWDEGCDAASKRLREEHPSPVEIGLCGHPPRSPSEADLVPATPPDDPEGEGHSLGLVAGCEEAYAAAQQDDEADICATGYVFG
jgi:hypothetical protein